MRPRQAVLRALAVGFLCGMLLPESVCAAPTVSVVLDAEDGDPLDFGWGIALEANGNLLVAGYESDNVLQRTPAGDVSVILGSSGDGVHALDGPTELAIGQDGSIYVIGAFSENVFQKPPGMPWVEILDAAGDGAGHPLKYPSSIAVDGSGNVFVGAGQLDSYYVLKVTPGGAVSAVIDASGDGAGHPLDTVSGLVTDAAGNLYVSASSTHNIFRVTPSAVITQIFASTPSVPCAYPANLVLKPDGTLFFTCGGASYETYQRDPDGTLTEMSYDFFVDNDAAGPNGTLLVSSSERILGFRVGVPQCSILDITGNGALPRDSSYGAVTAPNGVVYATGRKKVYRIDGACGAAPDVSGGWLVTLQSALEPDEPPVTFTQAWSQSGFDITVTESSGATYTGQIDDAGSFSLYDDAASCSQGSLHYCCPSASVFYGTVSPGGIRWDGERWPIFPGLHGCTSGGFPDTATGTRVGNGILEPFEQCEDENAANGDGCDSSGRAEACWQCDGSVPSGCTPHVRDCASAGGGGTSLKASADTGHGARLQWKLPGAVASTIDDLGDPTSATDYALCMFDRSGPEPSVLFSALVPASTQWRASSTGFSLKQKEEEAQQGITRFAIKSGDKTKVAVRASGPNLTLFSIPVAFPLTVQLQTSDAGCFEASYSAERASRNADGQLKAKADPLP